MERALLPTVLAEKDSHKITIITGPRQVGKTTLLKQLQERLGGLYIDFDILENAERYATYSDVITSLQLEGYDSTRPFYLFVDEFQKYPELTRILKNLHDHHPTIKIYASGSSSITMMDSIQESLAGRKFLHHLYPLDFAEFLKLRGGDIERLRRLHSFRGELPRPEFENLVTEYLRYGGYPEVVQSSEKEKVLASIFDTFVRKDLVDYLNIREMRGVRRLIQYLAVSNGQKLNISDASQQLGLTRQQVENYLQLLEEAFIIRQVRPYYTNPKKEIVKAQKPYFIDPGVRNYFCNNFNPIDMRTDTGFLFETFILGELIKHTDHEVKFWQDKRGHEVDFILDKVHEQIALEVKYKESLKAEDYRGLRHLGLRQGYVINLTRQDEEHLLPFSVSEHLG